MKVTNKFFAVIIYGTSILLTACHTSTPEFKAPVFDNLGSHSVEVTTQSEYSQQFFDQGLALTYGFNHAEAKRSFLEAIRLDSSNAMAYWGVAHILGPNYNAGMDSTLQSEAVKLINAALKKSDQISAWEKGLIAAAAARYNYASEKPQAALDKDYAHALRKLNKSHPENNEIATLLAEALMNLHPWDLYSRKGVAKPWTAEIEEILENVLVSNPDHPGANHFYIHAVEASSNPERGLVSAKRLPKLVPGSGHLVHMPSHIYIRTGDYHQGSEVNELATEVDSLYVASCNAQGAYPLTYFPHNIHFLAATAALEGRGETAINAAFRTAFHTDTTLMREPGMQTLQHYMIIPYYVLVKFAQWKEIMKLEKPADDLLYPNAIWHYARGMAYCAANKLERAKQELDEIEKIARDPELKNITVWDINSTDKLVSIANKVLKAQILQQNGHINEAIILLYEAVAIEDQLNYNEPPDWFFSVRHTLGAFLLQAARYEEAEAVYKEDLFFYPKNGWALNGLHLSLTHSGQLSESLKVLNAFETAWQYADIALEGSLVEAKKYNNIEQIPQMNNSLALAMQYIPLCGLKSNEDREID